MRKLWASALTPVLALAFHVIGSPAAHAFGSPAANAFGNEVLGCSVNTAAWTANYCEGGGDPGYYVVHFSPRNLSGAYSTRWTVIGPAGTAITGNCSTTTYPCISSGCTVSSLTCDIRDTSGYVNKTYTASLRLTQSGLTRTIKAQGLIGGYDPCTRC